VRPDVSGPRPTLLEDPLVRVPRLVTRALAVALAAAVGVAGCGDAVSTVASPFSEFEVRVSNVGDVTLMDLAVYVSPTDSVRIAALPSGMASAYRPVSRTHENPIVRASVGGRVLVANPVEGFATGINRVLGPGRYTVAIAAVVGQTAGAQRVLDVRVRRD
jgi:hypothetical protein